MARRPAPVFVSPDVPVITELIVAASAGATSTAAPPLSESVPPDNVTVPSSILTPVALCVPLTVTVNAPVASAPAEKAATFPPIQAAVLLDPVLSVLQLVLETFQVPAGVAPPAPA